MSHRLVKVENLGGLTEGLLEEMEGLAVVPGERDLKKPRLKFIRELLEDHEYNRCEWGRCFCKEDGKHYRVNGQHTSKTLRDVLDGNLEFEFPSGVPVMMWFYECDTMNDLSHVFDQFDHHKSTRTPDDKLGIYLAQYRDMVGIDKKLVNSCLVGIDWARRNIEEVGVLFPGMEIPDAHERGRMLSVDVTREFIALVHEHSNGPFKEWSQKSGITARLFDLFVADQESADLAVQQIFYEVGEVSKKFTHDIRQQSVRTGKDAGWYFRKADRCIRDLLKEQKLLGKDAVRKMVEEILSEQEEEAEAEAVA